MAGTDSTRAAVLGGPAVILVEPQLGENIGMVARAMLNCGLTDLRLVRPREAWPSERAVAAASGADEVLKGARLYDQTASAVADLRRVFATTARGRDMSQRIFTAREAMAELRAAAESGSTAEQSGVMFGPERSGLTNDDLTLADSLIHIPLNPNFSSLNLAQAVLVVGYEWFQTTAARPPQFVKRGGGVPASKESLLNFFQHLETRLDACGFLRPPEKRPAMVRNIRNIFQRATLLEQEINTLHGIVSGLATYDQKGVRKGEAVPPSLAPAPAPEAEKVPPAAGGVEKGLKTAGKKAV